MTPEQFERESYRRLQELVDLGRRVAERYDLERAAKAAEARQRICGWCGAPSTGGAEHVECSEERTA